MKDNEIINLAKELYSSIYITECYGAKDVPLLDDLMKVLEDRGYEINEDSKLSIVKGE